MITYTQVRQELERVRQEVILSDDNNSVALLLSFQKLQLLEQLKNVLMLEEKKSTYNK